MSPFLHQSYSLEVVRDPSGPFVSVISGGEHVASILDGDEGLTLCSPDASVDFVVSTSLFGILEFLDNPASWPLPS